MPPPLPYFKVNIYPFPFPHFASILFRLFVILSLTQLYHYTPEIFLFSTAHLNIPTGPPQTNWTRIVSERGLVNISVIETDTATFGLRWTFHMHSEFSRPTMCNNATWSAPLKCKVSLWNTDNCSNADYKNYVQLQITDSWYLKHLFLFSKSI